MKNSKLLLPLIALLVGASIASTLTFTLTRDSKSASSEPSYLFVYEGKNAELTAIGDSETEFTLTVPIASEDAKVTWFTDRPYRDAGHITYSQLANRFTTNEEDSFKADPPNVAIQIEDTTLIAKMTAPKIIPWLNGGKAFAANFVLVPQKDHKDLIGEESFLSQHITRNTQDQHGGAQTLKEVSVFIDNAGATVYRVGDTGPGGGKIFYVAPEPFWCGPKTGYESHCNYLEVAPTSGVNAWTDARYEWFDDTTYVQIGATAAGTAIGKGYANTSAIVGQASGGNTTTTTTTLDTSFGAKPIIVGSPHTPTTAAAMARAYGGPNNLSDWFLPSMDELNQLYLHRATVGGFVANVYWSSSEYSEMHAWSQAFSNGGQGYDLKDYATYVRPVRAF
jgi:hypothetical protein